MIRGALAAACALALALASCTGWVVQTELGPREEVDRAPLTPPHLVDADGVPIPPQARAEGARCVVEVRIDHAQPYAETARARRVGDIVGGAILAGVGVTGLATTAALSELDPVPDTGSSRDLGGGYLVGGAALVSGLAWLGLSYALLPADPPPEVGRGVTYSSEIARVDATGCADDARGRVGAPADADDDRDPTHRLRTLERLYDEGALSEDEYRARRHEILRDL